ncbi:hypothetical protein [Kitasatospora humi]|nr:hypothetical protein [Kitasatospora humi]
MRQRHAQMLQKRRLRVELITELVQSTDQAFHHGCETAAAFLLAR